MTSSYKLSPTANPSESYIQDPVIRDIFARELDRQVNCINLIASENYASLGVIEATGSIFTNKYAEGYPGKRYYGGCQQMDEIEQLAIDRAKQIFGADHANVQPHSGCQANTAVYLAYLEAGDTILSLDLAHGGHLSHGFKVTLSGKMYNVIHYTVDPKTEMFNYDTIRDLAKEHKPKLIVTGASAYPRTIDFGKFSEIAKSVGAYLLADIAHISGLVAAGLHPNPVPVCEFVTTTTHKTLRGPRGGLILTQADFAKKVDSAVFPGLQGGPLMNTIAAKAVAFGEALTPEFKEYQKQIIANAAILASELKSRGHRLMADGTDNHLMLVDLRKKFPELTGMEAQNRLEAANIIVNKNMIPFDERKPMQTSGLRIGTPATTTRGMKQDHMKQIAAWIDQVLNMDDLAEIEKTIKPAVREFVRSFPIFPDQPK
ncbi:MAG: serine hydroxymethyltransferase [Phycisphaerae bacterium]|nr:serine hydroxymethyltransferase [Phycisphaerae bacterium]